MKILVLDDERDRAVSIFNKEACPGVEFHWATTVPEAIAFYRANRYDKVYIDHDLCECLDSKGNVLVAKFQDAQGMDFIDWLFDRGRWSLIGACLYEYPAWMESSMSKTVFVIHSTNDEMAPKMALKLTCAGFTKVHVEPFKP